jgi:putative acetyltransferase
VSGSWQIDDLRAEDDEAAVALWVEAWNATMPERDFASRAAWLCQQLMAARDRGEDLFAAKHRDGALVGFVMLRSGDGHIEQICIARAAWGTGVAAFLLAEAEARAQAPLRLEVNEANHRARAFYTREGFVVTGPGGGTLSGLPTLLMARSV